MHTLFCGIPFINIHILRVVLLLHSLWYLVHQAQQMMKSFQDSPIYLGVFFLHDGVFFTNTAVFTLYRSSLVYHAQQMMNSFKMAHLILVFFPPRWGFFLQTLALFTLYGSLSYSLVGNRCYCSFCSLCTSLHSVNSSLVKLCMLTFQKNEPSF